MLITVESAAALNGALQLAKGGDTIQLAPGTYSGLAFKSLSFAGGVTITSVDPTHQAVLTDFSISGVSGLTFRNLEFAAIPHPDLVAAGAAGWAYRVTGSSHIAFDQVFFHGSLDGNSQNDVKGLSILNSSNISLTNSEFTQFERAAAMGTVDRLTVIGNYVHDVRSDAFDFAQVGEVRISGNTFKSFFPDGLDHPDAIQFWTTGTTAPSHDITITDNIILRGSGSGTQGIFLRDQLGTLAYERVTVANNLIIGTGFNAIRIGHVNDLTVTGNQLISLVGGDKTFMLIVDSDQVTSTNNSAISIGYENVTNLIQTGNVLNSAVSDGGAAALASWMAKLGDLNAPVTTITGDTADNALAGSAGANAIYGEAGNDTITEVAGVNYLRGGDGADRIIGGYGFDDINGNQGNDIAWGGLGDDWVVGGKDNDTLFGDAGSDLVYGNIGVDVCSGGDGDDIVRGGQDNDIVRGGAGNDWLSGDRGDDTVSGGAGADTFHTFAEAGVDRVTDFSFAAGDRVQLDFGTQFTVSQVGADTIINMSAGQMVLVGVSMASLGPGWIFGA